MLRVIFVLFKFVIVGNYDLMFDDEFCKKYEWFDICYNCVEMWCIIKEVEVDGVRYLMEGIYIFDLMNGVRFMVYVSLYMFVYGIWVF